MISRDRAIEMALEKARKELDEINARENPGGRQLFRLEDYEWVCTDAGKRRTFHCFLFTYKWPSPYWDGREHFAGHPAHFLVRVYDDDGEVALIQGE